MSKTFRGVVSAAATVALLGGLLPSAVAADANSPVIDVNAKGSISIHKRDGEPSANRATGKVDPAAPGNPLKDAKFKIERVKKDANTHFDFSKEADLTAAVALQADVVAKQAERLEEVLAPTPTDTDGLVSKDQLPVGVYLVTETEAPEGYVKGAPFLVFIPTSDNATATAEKWIYDVHVYPKNTNVPVVKKVKDADKHQGQNITYTIETGVAKPREESTGDIKKYIVTDTIYTTHDSVKFANEQAVKSVKVGADEATAEALAADDYTVALENNGKIVNVTLTDSGLKKITDAVKGNVAVKVFTTLEMEIGADFNLKDGIENGTSLRTNPNNKQDDEDTTIPGNKVKSYFGKLKIVKKGNKNNALLEGAKFKVFECQADGTSADEAKPVFNEEFTTDANGEVTFPVMHVTNIADNENVPNVKKYCVKETAAPAGYQLPANPVTPVDFKTTDFADNATQTLEMEKTIVNEKRITPELPLTGGAGIALFILGGAGLIGAGTMAARRNSKKNA